MKTVEFNYLLHNLKDKDCFEKFYRECFPLIIKYSNYLYHGKDFSMDIAQDIFNYLFAHENPPYVRNPHAWLYILCKNNGIKYVKTNKYETELVDNAPYTSFTEMYDCGDLDSILSDLKPDERELIELNEIVGFSLKEIAVIQNKTYAATLKQHFRILKKLEKKLSKKM